MGRSELHILLLNNFDLLFYSWIFNLIWKKIIFIDEFNLIIFVFISEI